MRSLAALPLLSLALVAQTPLEVQAPITRVRVHPDEAWVTRVGTLTLPRAGTFRLDVAGLPRGLALEDIRLSARGPEGLRTGDISVGEDPVGGPALAARRGRQRAAQERLQVLEAKAEALAGEIAALRKAADLRSTEAQGRPLEALALVESAKAIHLRLGDLLLAEKRLGTELRLAKADPDLAEPTGLASSRASLEVVSQGPGTLELTLLTRTREARWKPSYEARLNADHSRLELVLFATISQRSGEDWTQVPLELSTAARTRTHAAPELEPPVELTWEAPRPLLAPHPHLLP